MTEQQRERLSALIDAQLDHQEISNEIIRLVGKNGAREEWCRYHLIGDAIRQELGPMVDSRLAERISKRLEQEPVVLAPAALPRKTGSWQKPAAGIAIAASVAIMAVTLTPQFINPPSASRSGEIAASDIQPAKYIYEAEDGTRWDMLQKPKVESRLNNYLVNHQEFAPAGNMKGIMPYAAFVSYDGGK
ncbi:MAG: sigma-E factor negative regulatory protein [Chromatiales bacterium]|jgi:sigma-E factor negative regulatory protein RseA